MKLYSDKSPTGSWSMKNGYPIYLTLANIPANLQNLDQFKVPVGFLPVIEEENLMNVPKTLRSCYSSVVWHRCMSQLLKVLKFQPDEVTENKNANFFKFVCGRNKTCLASRKKAANFSRLKQPCYTCKVTGENLDKFQLSPERDIDLDNALINNTIDSILSHLPSKELLKT